MNGYFRGVIHEFFKNFARPSFDLGSDDKIHEADELIKELEERKKALERRQKLLQIQGNPRGMHG